MRSVDRTLSVPAVDGFRGLAVLWVVLGHCWNDLGGRVPFDSGLFRNVFVSSYFGVDLLFVASGFVLFLPVATKGTIGDWRSYARRRAARIVPAFYLALILSFLVSVALDRHRIGLGGWLSHLLFLHGEAHPPGAQGFGVNGAMWTMSVEVLFYIALPLVAFWYRRRPFLGLILAFVVAETWHALTLNLPAILDELGISWASTTQAQLRMALAFPGYIAHFAVGMTAAWLYVHVKERDLVSQRQAAYVQVGALGAALFIAAYRGSQGVQDLTGLLDHWVKTSDRVLIFGVLILATALAPKVFQWPFRNSFSRMLGVVCYGTYLVHLPLIKLTIPTLGFDIGTTSEWSLLRLAAIIVPISVGLGITSYAFVEQPFRMWARRTRKAEDSAAITRSHPTHVE